MKLNLRLISTSTIAPTAPTDAASVGVAMPPRIEPSTATISASGGISDEITSRTSVAFSSFVGGVAGQLCGSVMALKTM